MNTRALSWAILGVLVVGSIARAGEKTETISGDGEASPTPTTLARRMPVIDTDSITCPPFDVSGRVRLADGGFELWMRYRRPGRFDFVALDTTDASPFAVCQDRTLIIFDAAKPQFVVGPDMKMQWSLAGGSGKSCNFNFKFDTNKKFPQRVFIDVPSMLTSAAGELTDEGSTDDVIRLVHRGTEGKKLETELSLNAASPVCTLRLWEDDEEKPRATISLTLHATEQQPLARMPSREALENLFPVHAPPENAELNDLLDMLTLSWKGVASHFGTWDASTREMFKFPGVSELNWDEVTQNKRRHSAAVGELFGLPAAANPDDQPITPQMAAEATDEPTRN